MSKVYKCRDCGALDTIVEIEIVPRINRIQPDSDGEMKYTGSDEVWIESGLVTGFGCENEACRYWQGNLPEREDQEPVNRFIFKVGLDLADVAEVIEL